MNSIGIIGFGRFGKVLANILQKGFAIKAYDPKPIGEFPGVEFTDLQSLLKEKVIFVAVFIFFVLGFFRIFSSFSNMGTGIFKNVNKYLRYN